MYQAVVEAELVVSTSTGCVCTLISEGNLKSLGNLLKGGRLFICCNM